MTTQFITAAQQIQMAWKNGRGSTIEIASDADEVDGTWSWRFSMAHITNREPFSLLAGVDRCIACLHGEGLRMMRRRDVHDWRDVHDSHDLHDWRDLHDSAQHHDALNRVRVKAIGDASNDANGSFVEVPREGEAFRFAGEEAWIGEPVTLRNTKSGVQGADAGDEISVHDINLMVRRDRWHARMRVVRHTHNIGEDDQQKILLAQGECVILFAATTLSCVVAHIGERLFHVEQGCALVVRCQADDAQDASVNFLTKVGDVVVIATCVPREAGFVSTLRGL